MPGSKLEFNARNRWAGLACATLIAAFAAYLALYAYVALGRSGFHRFGDFFPLWSSAGIAWNGEAALNYDMDALHARQVALGMDASDFNPFPYPPTFLVALAPLGAFGYGAAYALWMATTALAYFWAVAGARLRRSPILAAALVAPSTTVNLVAGQTGFLSAALTLGGLRLLGERPIVAGILLGLMSYKAQLGLLVPIALVSAGLWRVIAAAAATMLVSAIVAGAVFGWSVWALWLAELPAYSAQFDAHNLDFRLMPTVMANLEMLGASPSLALAAQGAVALAVAAAIWRRFRSGASPQACIMLIAGGFLATPHAFAYDLPMLTGAVFWFVEQRLALARRFSLGEAAAFVLVLILPAAMAWPGAQFPISWLPELLAFAIFARESDLGSGPERARPATA